MIKQIILAFIALNAVFAQPGNGKPPPPSGGGGMTSGASCPTTGSCTGNCYSTALSFYAETISGSTVHIQSNGIPQAQYMHSIAKANPNKPCEQKTDWTFTQITTKPTVFTDTGAGAIGISRSGQVIYNHLASFDGSGLNDVANHIDGESQSLDACYGHSDPSCNYHLHAISKQASCSKDGSYNDCELMGWLIDGRRFYSYCQNAAKSRYLSSCYVLTGTGGESTSDYTFTSSSSCDLDEANGYDFTGKGINDNLGNAITGYAYVATDAYPWTQPKLGSDYSCDGFKEGTFDTSANAGGCTPGSCSSTSSIQNTATNVIVSTNGPPMAGYSFKFSIGLIATFVLALLQ